KLDDPQFVALVKQVASLHDEVFVTPDDQLVDDTIKQWRNLHEPFVFKLNHGRYDEDGNCLETDIGYITLEIVDNWYLRQHPDKPRIFASYISYDWHLKEIEKAKRAVKDEVGDTVADALDKAFKGKF